MIWLAAGLVGVVAIALYTAAINREFLRCPHCRKIGSWRFDDLGAVTGESDDDGVMLKTAQRQACRKCGGEVVQEWSDSTGRTIRKG